MGAPRLEQKGDGRYALAGDLVFGSVAALLPAGESAFGGRSPVEVDLRQVKRLDSAGLALLLEWSLAARAQGREIRYRHAPPVLGTLAGMAGVDGLLATTADEGA